MHSKLPNRTVRRRNTSKVTSSRDSKASRGSSPSKDSSNKADNSKDSNPNKVISNRGSRLNKDNSSKGNSSRGSSPNRDSRMVSSRVRGNSHKLRLVNHPARGSRKGSKRPTRCPARRSPPVLAAALAT